METTGTLSPMKPPSPRKHRRRLNILDYWQSLTDVPGVPPRFTFVCGGYGAPFTWTWEVVASCRSCLLEIRNLGHKSLAVLETALTVQGFRPPFRPRCSPEKRCYYGARLYTNWDAWDRKQAQQQAADQREREHQQAQQQALQQNAVQLVGNLRRYAMQESMALVYYGLHEAPRMQALQHGYWPQIPPGTEPCMDVLVGTERIPWASMARLSPHEMEELFLEVSRRVYTYLSCALHMPTEPPMLPPPPVPHYIPQLDWDIVAHWKRYQAAGKVSV